jgi:hypothetical protein
MWKGKVNVTFNYKALPLPAGSPEEKTPDLDDLVESQSSAKSKVGTFKGISSSATLPNVPYGWAFNWRGKGLLGLLSSRWEILGWGEEESGNTWMVIHFRKTLFTPKGIDIMSSSPNGPSPETLADIELRLTQTPSLADLVPKLFDVHVVLPKKADV